MTERIKLILLLQFTPTQSHKLENALKALRIATLKDERTGSAMQRGSRVRIISFIYDLHGEHATITRITGKGTDRRVNMQLDTGLNINVKTLDIKEIEPEPVIGSCGLCNIASLNLYQIDDNADTIKAGINDDKGKTYKLYSTNKGFYFCLGGSRYYLSKFMRV